MLANFSVRTLDDWYRSGDACRICQNPGLCSHRDIDVDVARLGALRDAIWRSKGPKRETEEDSERGVA